MKKILLAALAVTLFMGGQHGYGAVPAEEAALLKTKLTPLGGERAGNQEGTIPEWDGGITSVPGKTKGDVPVKLFSDEKPLIKITAANMAEYADKLTPGTQALFQKYPDTFRIDVYPTHRTSAAPQYVYENTLKNATDCKPTDNGNSMEGCYGGIPFPIPKSGKEIVWNYLLRIEAEAIEYGFKNLLITADGTRTLATRNDNFWDFPYYYKEGSAKEWNGKYFLQRFSTTAPAFKVGESLVIHDSIDPKQYRQAWQYLVGQRRVRRAPTVGYDTPDFVASGANYFDEVQGYFGAPDRYDWKIVGKQEMYIPYNNNELVTSSVDEGYAERHFNPDKMRWEMHRVWVVEGNIAESKRHAVPKRRLYFDEDSWIMVLMDGYDANGTLWRTSQMTPFVVPKIPAMVVKPVIVFNLQANTASTVQGLMDETYRVVKRKPADFYTGEAVAADSMR
ncbi:DUF1329 domain-containing protein [Desulfuromonas sp. TF]|uniref:DUF1329 domain-containing protein n=1 Tax=Desulfuromonas sp. TF TaxID=1232410 RepID=UPI00041409BB|nr:DUF1329 domain-containing protein [Desulfuromonas sp. TF]